MARPRAKLDYHNSATEVVNQYRLEKNVWKKERLLAIKLLMETDQSYQEVANIIGRARSIVQVWAKAFQDGGLDALLTSRLISRRSKKPFKPRNP